MHAVDEYLLPPRPEHVHGTAQQVYITRKWDNTLSYKGNCELFWKQFVNRDLESIRFRHLAMTRRKRNLFSTVRNHLATLLVCMQRKFSHAHVQVLETGGTRPLHSRETSCILVMAYKVALEARTTVMSREAYNHFVWNSVMNRRLQHPPGTLGWE